MFHCYKHMSNVWWLQDVLVSHLWYQILETGDDVGAFEFLVVAKTAGHDHHSDESDGQIKLQTDRQTWSPSGNKRKG